MSSPLKSSLPPVATGSISQPLKYYWNDTGFRNKLLLFLVILAGAWLRLYHLGFQSLWFDELHTAIQSDPALREHSLFYYLRTVEQQPPLFFWLEQCSIALLGNKEWTLRIVPALASIASIAAIYNLGRTIKGQTLGLYAAILLCVNEFSIHYAQEARPYSLVILFSILSWTAFLRFIQTLDGRRCFWYMLPTVLMLYTNYFALLVVASQMLVGCIILWRDMPDTRKWLRWLALSCVILALAFSPLLPLLKQLAQMKKFWAQMPDEQIGITYFYGFFGSSDLLKPFLQLGMISFFLHFFWQLRTQEAPSIRSNPYLLLFIMCCCWVFLALLVPFVRSWLVVPMMVLRYSATLVTAFILLLAAGLEAVHSRLVRGILLLMFTILSTTHLFIVKDFYNTIYKEQFRELAKLLSQDVTFKKFPLITGTTAWHQAYYLRKHQIAGKVHSTDLQTPEVLNAIRKGNADGFWLAGGHVDLRPDDTFNKSFDSSYIRLTDGKLHSVWAQLFVSKRFFGDSARYVDLRTFPASNRYQENGKETLGIWDNNLVTGSIGLPAGQYKCLVVAYGSPVNNVYPNLHCSINGQDLSTMTLWPFQSARSFDFQQTSSGPARLSFWIDNDAANPVKREDRNASIREIFVLRTNAM